MAEPATRNSQRECRARAEENQPTHGLETREQLPSLRERNVPVGQCGSSIGP